MPSCSSAILGIERFTIAYARQVYEHMLTLIQSRSLELHYQSKLIKLVNSTKADFLLVGINLNTCVQEKTPETCTFHGSWMMLYKQGALKIFKC